MSRLSENGRCLNSECTWIDARHPESPHHLRRHSILLGRYYTGRVLGQGGFGITYMGWDLHLARRVAIKEFFPSGSCLRGEDRMAVRSFNADDADLFRYGLDRFLDEARNLARLGGHPNIVLIMDYVETNGTAYMIMEYIPGVSLKQYLAENGSRIPKETARDILLHVMSGLREVHENGLLHRDVSPDNIMLSTDGPIKLIDFGAARSHLREASRGLSIILKADYAPLEQYERHGNQGPWTDVYAAAATFYRCITGEAPALATDRNAGSATLRPPRLACPDISRTVEEALLKGLAVKAGDRYQSIDEFQRALLGEEVEVPRNLIPPSLDWIALVAFSLMTAGLFPIYWTIVQAGWARKFNPRIRAPFTFFAIYAALSPIGYLVSFIPFAFIFLDPNFSQQPLAEEVVYQPFLLGAAILLLGLVFFFLGTFAMRNPVAACYKATQGTVPRLSVPLTFFGNIFYIQFHLNSIAKHVRAAALAESARAKMAKN